MNAYQKDLEKIPKAVHLWEIDGFVRLSDQARIKFEKLVKEYGVRKLARDLQFDRETIDSLYRKGRKNGSHSIKYLLIIANRLEYNIKRLEKEVVAYGRIQTNIYNLRFPFILNPLHVRAISIHGDGSFGNQASWYQKHHGIHFMAKLLNKILKTNEIKARRKDGEIYYITIPSLLLYLVCKSLNIKGISSLEFFKKITELPRDFIFQTFSQFIIDEGHFKGTTFTVSQHKQETRKGFLVLLKALGYKHSKPMNNKQDITIYGFNFPRILKDLDRATNKYGGIAGFWFKEKQFREICQKANPQNSLKVLKNRL